MRNNKQENKDPFAEYDKFWDELDKAEEIRDDEDYFKERSIYKDEKYKKVNKNKPYSNNKKLPNTSIFFFIFGFVAIFLFAGNLKIGNIIFALLPIIMFGVFGYIILSIIARLKNL